MSIVFDKLLLDISWSIMPMYPNFQFLLFQDSSVRI